MILHERYWKSIHEIQFLYSIMKIKRCVRVKCSKLEFKPTNVVGWILRPVISSFEMNFAYLNDILVHLTLKINLYNPRFVKNLNKCGSCAKFPFFSEVAITPRHCQNFEKCSIWSPSTITTTVKTTIFVQYIYFETIYFNNLSFWKHTIITDYYATINLSPAHFHSSILSSGYALAD